MPDDDYRKYLDPKVLQKITRLELRARLIVEGFISGRHKSPFHGFSVEFAQHREYVPGDDTRHIDWKLWSRSDRYYIKQYEEETNLRCYILLDMSESMRYGSPDHMNKFDYASCVAGSLAFMLLQQQDAVSLTLFDTDIRRFVPPSGHPAHIKTMLSEVVGASQERKTEMESIFHNLAEKIARRGVIVVVSDLFVPVESLIKGIQHLRHKRHDVIVFQVLDEYELSFPFQSNTMFHGLEGYPEVLVEPRSLREAYLREFDTFNTELRRRCVANNVDFVQLKNSDYLDAALAGYLASRSARAK
ncbi:MAG: DUF58 domain-containing protein [Planctomycetota bacterium]